MKMLLESTSLKSGPCFVLGFRGRFWIHKGRSMAQNTVRKGREKLCAPKLENYSRLELVRVRVRKRRTKEKSPEIVERAMKGCNSPLNQYLLGFKRIIRAKGIDLISRKSTYALNFAPTDFYFCQKLTELTVPSPGLISSEYH